MKYGDIREHWQKKLTQYLFFPVAPHYFPTDCFGGSSNSMGNDSTLFSDRLFWKFGGNRLHIIFRRIVLEAAQIWRELAPDYFPTDCFRGISNLEGTGSTLFSSGSFLEIWRELAPRYFLADCFGGSSNLARTGSTLFSDRFFDCLGGSSNLAGTSFTLFSGGLFWKFGGNWLHIISGGLIWRQQRFGGN